MDEVSYSDQMDLDQHRNHYVFDQGLPAEHLCNVLYCDRAVPGNGFLQRIQQIEHIRSAHGIAEPATTPFSHEDPWGLFNSRFSHPSPLPTSTQPLETKEHINSLQYDENAKVELDSPENNLTGWSELQGCQTDALRLKIQTQPYCV